MSTFFAKEKLKANKLRDIYKKYFII
jgi:hypothetical protein